jgi:hypothetical protein
LRAAADLWTPQFIGSQRTPNNPRKRTNLATQDVKDCPEYRVRFDATAGRGAKTQKQGFDLTALTKAPSQ